jgi:hypothetical protein
MSLRRAAVAACILAVSVPSVALAASVKAGGEYSNQTTVEFALVAKSGKTVSLTINPGKCARGISMTATKPAKIKGKTVTYSGAVKSAIGTPGKMVLTGTFTNSKTLKWSAKITVGTCHATSKSTLTLH